VITIKKQLIDLCQQAIDKKIAECSSAISLARESSKEETKSSAGDKYETARAMIQQEIDKYSMQLQDAEKQKAILSSLQPSEDSIIRNGSLIITNNGNFFISISIGELTIDNKKYFAISSASPIGALLLHKRKGDAFQFRGKDYSIEKVG
jgi:transcription elongation GreA/GreB family factor